MPRPTFPCDVRSSSDKQFDRQSAHEIPHANVGSMLPDYHLEEDLAIDFAALMAEVAKINVRAPSWVAARLEGLTDVELASAWGVTPQAVNRWFYIHGRKVQTVIADYLGVEMNLTPRCATHASLMA